MELAEVLEAETGGQLSPQSSSLEVKINTATRSLEKNQTFWALSGDNFDGHDYIDTAFDQGCAACVVNHDWYLQHPDQTGSFFTVRDTYKALLSLGAKYADRFSFPKIAVTGSNGKTTVKEMLYAVLQKKGSVLSTRGNFNNHIGVPLTLFELKKSHDFAVIELGSNHSGEIAVLSETVKPDFCIITSIGHSHIEFFKTLDEVLAEKLSIVQGMAKGGTLLVNADDEYLSRLVSTSDYRLNTVGIENGDLKAENVEMGGDGCARFTVQGTKYQLHVAGRHNIYNALMAIAAGLAYGVEHQNTENGIRKGHWQVTQFLGTGTQTRTQCTAVAQAYQGLKGLVRTCRIGFGLDKTHYSLQPVFTVDHQ